MMRHVRNAALPFVARVTPRPPPAANECILLVQPDHLGDVLLSQPAVRRIRAALPEAHLTAVVGPWAAEIAARAWPVDRIVTIPFPGFTRTTAPSRLTPYLALRGANRELRALGASQAVVLRPDAWWAAWLAASSVHTVVGSTDPRVAPFATTRVRVDPTAHAVVRGDQLASGLYTASGAQITTITPINNPLTLPVDENARQRARSLLAAAGVEGRYAVIHPGSGAAVKEWPMARWRAVATYLTSQGLQVCITGSAGEQDAAQYVAGDLSGAVSVAGQTPLGELIELLRGAALVVGPDCGPLHLAVATATPSLTLFGPSDPRRYGPWGSPARHRIIESRLHCTRCGDLSASRGPGCGCMLAIGVPDVVDTAQQMLDSA
jgi:heptosyltransferase-3